MPIRLLPATLAYSADGTPYSPAFDDVYHSSAGGPAQARHVFLSGNNLPARWRGVDRFTILETGFGIGLNFLATWATWIEDPARPAKLHYVSIELQPFAAADLEVLHAKHAEFAFLSAQLRAAWPILVPGMHRIELDGGRVVLTLCFGDAATVVRDLRLSANAFYLDGFSPAKNPAIWSAPLLRTLARLAADDATLATYTVATSVRDGLAAAGFRLEPRPGFAHKREMLSGALIAARRSPVESRSGPPPGGATGRRAIVIGAGLAGSSVCERLAARGWDVTLIERHAAPAQEASGNHAGAFHPLVTRDDSYMARISRASFLHALRHWQSLEGVSWSRCGVLQMARDAQEDAAQRLALAELGYPEGYARQLARSEASAAAGAEVASGGVWFAEGGWIQPASLVNALLAKADVSKHFGIEVHRLEQENNVWTALDKDGWQIASAPVVVLANAHDAICLLPQVSLELRRVRGQVSYLPAEHLPAIRSVLLRGGMAIPAVEGISVVGATYDLDETDPKPSVAGHEGNLRRLSNLLPGAGKAYDAAALAGRVAFRTVARDRLPLVGPIPGAEGVYAAFAYASRGILWCSLMAELLASQLDRDPLPLESKLTDAVAPARLLRQGRTGG